MSNGMISLKDFLSGLNGEYKEVMENARDGGPSGAFDGPPMPLDTEYRVTVDTAEYKPSKASGVKQLAVTYEISEPSEFAGRKLQEYYQPAAGNEISLRKFSEVIGCLGPDLTGLGTTADWDVVATRLVGLTAVIALRVWGDDDRYGVRWINSNRGQSLKTNLKPVKARTDSRSLRPDVTINKGEPFPPTETPASPVQAETSPAALPQAPRPNGGPNLPPGLR